MKKILIANRGEIAVRIIKTCRDMGITTVAVASEADVTARHAQYADECVIIGPPPSAESYLVMDRVIQAAKDTGAEAIHPGFGFLSENAKFASAVRKAGLIFIGPEADTIEVMGSKQLSKRLMIEAGVPVVPGYTGDDQNPEFLLERAEEIVFPLLIKASAGGGGKGMRIVHARDQFEEELGAAKREAIAAFGDDTVLLEKYLLRPRHIEYQVFGSADGRILHLFERECSIQRRHQKIVEETPSTALDPELRERMAQAAVAAAAKVDYRNAGTVEFMLDEDGSFYFLEMNTRLQVEHPVTEMATGVDLVRWQIMTARGEPVPMQQEDLRQRGHALEVRVYAEDPEQNFFPQTGTVLRYREPDGLNVRVDSGVREGDPVSIYYDPMIAKLITWGADREEACEKMVNALREYCIHGVRTNISFLRAIIEEPHFRKGDTTTDYLAKHFAEPRDISSLLDDALALATIPRGAASAGGETVRDVAEPWTQLTGWRGEQ